MQERLTQQIAEAVINAIRPTGVGVIIEGVHMCMCMRGYPSVSLSLSLSLCLALVFV